jgi:hypothetical protein
MTMVNITCHKAGWGCLTFQEVQAEIAQTNQSSASSCVQEGCSLQARMTPCTGHAKSSLKYNMGLP